MNIVVGNKLKALRKNKKMSQEEVADYLFISQSAYARMESGESHSWANHILRICKIFEITPDELLRTDKKTEFNPKRKDAADAVTQLSDKVIEQYEERIKELKKVIKDLKKDKKTLES
jgi:transcriptional regulator with XRE-family HTH domain